MALTSPGRSGGARIEMCRPSISPAEYPNIRSAPAFQLMIVPSRALPTIASSEDSTMAASRESDASARFRSVMSRIEHFTIACLCCLVAAVAKETRRIAWRYRCQSFVHQLPQRGDCRLHDLFQVGLQF